MGCECSSSRIKEPRSDISLHGVFKTQTQEYQVLLYTKSDCPQSTELKQMLKANKVKFEYFDLDHMEDNGEFHAALREITGKWLTPYIFIGGRLITQKDLEKTISEKKLYKLTKGSS